METDCPLGGTGHCNDECPFWVNSKCNAYEICACGDYRHQHENGTGKCKMPNDLCHGFEPCLEFHK